jgi:hypothetical protein
LKSKGAAGTLAVFFFSDFAILGEETLLGTVDSPQIPAIPRY